LGIFDNNNFWANFETIIKRKEFAGEWNMKLVIQAEKVRLKDGVLPHLETREWEIQTIERGLVILKHRKYKITLRIKEDYIEKDSPNGE